MTKRSLTVGIIMSMMLYLFSPALFAQNNYQSYINQGLASQKRKSLEQANLFFTQAIRLNPNNPQGFALRGDNYLSMHQYTLALQDFDKLVALNPTMPWGLGKRGFSKIQLGRYREAVTDFERAIQLNDRAEFPFLMLAEAKYKAIQQQYNSKKPPYSYFSVVGDYSQVLQRNPQNVFALRRRAEARLDSIRIGVNPPNVPELQSICQDLQYAQSKGDQEAGILLQQYCSPEVMAELIAEKHLQIIRDLFYNKKERETKTHFEIIFRILKPEHPLHIEARYLSAQIHYNTKQYWEAINDYEIILKNRAPMPERYLQGAYYGIALSHGALQDYRRALEQINKAIDLGYTFSWVYYERGIIHDALGDKTSACEDWRKSLAMGSLPAYTILKKRGCKGRFRKPK